MIKSKWLISEDRIDLEAFRGQKGECFYSLPLSLYLAHLRKLLLIGTNICRLHLILQLIPQPAEQPLLIQCKFITGTYLVRSTR